MKHTHEIIIIISQAFLLVLTSSFASQSKVIFSDEFNGAFKSEWSIENINSNYFSLSNSGLILRCCSGDIFSSKNDHKNIFLIDNPAPYDFTLTLKGQWIIPPSTVWGQITLVAYDDEDNHTRVGNVRFRNMMAIESLSEENAIQVGIRWSAKDFVTKPFWLQMRKEGMSYSAWSSTDGENFIQAHPAIMYGKDLPARLGFVAMVDPAEAATVFVDSFTVEADLPLLEIDRSGEHVAVRWPKQETERFDLQTTTNLSLSSVWTDYTGQFFSTENDFTATNNTVMPNFFYRLILHP